MRNTFISLLVLAMTIPFVGAFGGQKKAAGTTFNVGSNVVIVLAEGKPGTLTDLTVGDRIRITYHGDVSNAVIEQIHLIVPRKKGVKGARVRVGNDPADGTTHLHGIITAVDPKAGTVTVRVKQRQRRQPNRS